MGTEIEANAFLREPRSVIDLDGSISNGIRSFHNENQIGRSNEDRGLFASYDLEKVRRTILEHESVFRNQIQELHRLYGRQRQLMNEIKRREINKHDDIKCQSSYMFSPHPREDAKRPRYPYHSSSTHSSVSLFPSAQDKSSLRICEHRSLNGAHNQADAYSRNMEKLASCSRDNRLWLSGVQSSQRKADDLAFDLFLKRNNNPGVISINNPTDGVSDRLALSRGEMCVNPFSNSNLVTKDFFQNSMDRKNGEYSPVILGSRGERSGKELLSDDYADKRRLNKHSDKPQAFPQSLLAEPKKGSSTCPLDIGASVSRKRKKIFGVEICEEPLYAASNKSSEFGRQKPYDENQRVFSSSWIANSFAQSLDLRGSNLADGKSERSKEADNLDMNGKWLEGCSSVGSKFVEVPNQHSRTYFENFDNMKMPAEVSKKDSDCQNNQDEGLPWFLRSQVNDDQSKEKKNSYFMNLDSLQNCSKKFFGKDEVPDGTNGSSQLKEKTSEPMAAEGGTNEANDVTSAKKILGFLISDAVQGFKDLNSGENLSKVETNKGSNRHCIDLNLSLDDEDALSTPSPAVIESEKDALPSVADSKKKGEKSELPSEERDNIAAEAMIAISLSISVNDDSLKWFAEIVSSQCGDSSDALVEVPVNQSRVHDEEEDESVPDGMDYFEFMTLKLEDKGEKHYQYEPRALSDDEAGPTHTKRSRRGQSRRGRQRKDFQRDVLPSLTTLSRLQVKEDFQAFEELLKADGSSSWQSNRSSTRNGRGRKRSVGANSSPRIKTLCSAQAEQPICQLEGRCLAGWGKRTRRLPRQRCPNALLSFPVKC